MKDKYLIKKNIPLASFSTFAIGSYAKYFISVDNPQEFKDLIIYAKNKNIPVKVFAKGSNIVFPDQSLDCLLIQYLGGKIQVNTNRMLIDAGVILSEVISLAIKNGLKGLENLSGIPGTIGGAIVGNAGAYGHSISEVLEKVEVFDGKKNWWLRNSDCQFSYRESIFKNSPLYILRVVINLFQSKSTILRRYSNKIIKLREKKYPPGLKCPGSFFKNILIKNVDKKSLQLLDHNKIIDGKISAGYLLEQIGACGMKVGGIEISSYHGNLFINKGKGKAKDVVLLSKILKKKVFKKFKILLEEEIRYF